MKTKAILKALYAISYPIPINEVQLIMDKELEKDLDEMDDELIDICMTILERGDAEQGRKKSMKKKSIKKKHKEPLI